ncbi:MAG: S46 family peptidase [Bacteroidia bacterium]
MKTLSRKIISLFVIAFLISTSVTRADEGMWLLNKLKQINEAEMQGKGLKLSADDIYNINKSCVKDAIVQMGTVSGNSFGGFCTAEVISDQGLMITNHHCGLDAVQSHSSVDHDYLKNGYWAMNREQELPNEGLGVRFLIRMEDVSQDILKNLSDTMSEAARNSAILKAIPAITKKATEGTTYTADVKGFYKGSEFYLFVYEIYRDIRLVGTPPYAVGNFGGDTDNWIWPRHTGDFSMFRIYANKDNNPAEYSKDNVAYKPKSYLPISMNGVKQDDFSMIIGFPGRTDRFATSEGIKMTIELTNPTTVDIRTKKLDIMNAAMEADAKVRIQYQEKHNLSSNYWKYFIGQTKQLKRNHVVETKLDLENQFTKWVNADAGHKAKYGTLLNDIAAAYAEARKYALSRTCLNEAIGQGSEILFYAYGYDGLAKLLENKEAKPEEIKQATDELRKEVDEYFKNYDANVDRKLFAALIKIYHDKVPAEQQSSIIDEELKENKGSYEKWADELFEESMFSSKEKVLAFLDDPKLKKLKKDDAYIIASSIINNYRTNWSPKASAADLKLSRLQRLWIAGLREMSPDKNFYPDANSTMRLTYGSIKDYIPADGMSYNYYTTLDGIMEKMDPENPDYAVPDKLVELWKKKDYGPYAENGVMKVGFISNNDITGGNSGSGILNSKGELIGLAFDGNWEAMSGDIYYDPKLKRCINVDIRYVLFIIDKLGGAGHLIKEMKLVN